MTALAYVIQDIRRLKFVGARMSDAKLLGLQSDFVEIPEHLELIELECQKIRNKLGVKHQSVDLKNVQNHLIETDDAIGTQSARRSLFPNTRYLDERLKARHQRSKYFGDSLFGEPAWDMILYMASCDIKGRTVSVTELCYAAGVPATTALRWTRVLEERGVIVRLNDTQDKRRVFVELTEQARTSISRYFSSWR